MAGGQPGGPACEMVRADGDDLSAFVDAGSTHLTSLRQVFDALSTARWRTSSAVGVPGSPTGRTARTDGGWDPLAELIAEATAANAFVATVRDALADDDAVGVSRLVPADLVDRALARAGLGELGPDRSMAADQRLAEDLAIRRELAEVVAELDRDAPDHLRPALVGLALEEWLGMVDGSDPDRLAAVARVLVAVGVERRADRSGPTGDIDPVEEAVAAMLVTQGVLLWPGDRGDLVDELADRSLPTTDGTPVPAIRLLVDALDLDQTNEHLNLYGLGTGEWQRANQPWVRTNALVMLIQATIADDGTISSAGQRLAEEVLDRHPAVVDLADGTWHDAWDDDRHLSTPDGRACRVWPTEGIRAVLARALAAPNHGLDRVGYDTALRLDELDARLAAAAVDGDPEFPLLWSERFALVDRLAGGDPDVAALIDQAMAQGLTGPEALRLATTAADPDRTDDRVRRLRVLHPTTAWGDPVPVSDLDPGRRPGDALPPDLARSLAIELGVLQTVQLARFAEGRPVPRPPLTTEQVDLVRRYDEVARWFHHRFAGSFPGGAEPAIAFLADYDADELSDILHDLPDGFPDLVADLDRSENQTVWDLLAGAADNDTFLGPDGTFRPPDGSHVSPGDARALLVQLALLSSLGPHQGDLDLDGSGTIHEDEVAEWLEAAARDGSIPPALIDRVRVGTSHGVGQDTFGWDEIGDLIGWVGLAAAVTATIVYSGGTAAPLWVQAGLVGLAGLEAVAHLRADDPASATLAGLGGLADLAAAARLIRLARTAPIEITADVVEAERRYDEVVRRLLDGGATPAEASAALRAAGIDPFDPITARRIQNAGLLDDTDRLATDLDAARLTPADLDEMFARRKPLGFESAQQWRTFQRELDQALSAAGLADAEIGLKGTATTFYSENPSKPLGHHWDADPANPGDYDFNVASPQLIQDMAAEGIEPSRLGIFATRHLEARYPALDEFARRWSEILDGREVNFVGLPDTEVVRDPTEYVLASGQP